MKSEAQKEAKRLYKLFYDKFNEFKWFSKSHSLIKGEIAKEAALIAADEMEKRALTWADPSEHDTIKDYFKQLKNAIKSL